MHCVFTGGDNEGLSTCQCGGDVQELSGGRGALGADGVPAGRSPHRHRVSNQVRSRIQNVDACVPTWRARAIEWRFLGGIGSL